MSAWFRTQVSRVLQHALPPLVLLACASCSALVDHGRQQCNTNDDCQQRGGSFANSTCVDNVCEADPKWSCVGQLSWPPAESRKFNVTIHIRDLITEDATPNVTARLCRKVDTMCAQPVPGEFTGNSLGDLLLRVDGGFDGYVEIKAPDKMPGLYFFYPPVAEDREIPFVPLFHPAILNQFAMLGMKTTLPDRGHVILITYNCLHSPAEGVRLVSANADDKSSTFYVNKGLPNLAATETDSSGRAGFINLPAGSANVASELVSDGRQIAYVSVLVRPSAITYLSLVPSPK
jgi:hypothetical protein